MNTTPPPIPAWAREHQPDVFERLGSKLFAFVWGALHVLGVGVALYLLSGLPWYIPLLILGQLFLYALLTGHRKW